MAPPVKAFVHAERLDGDAAVSNGNKASPKHGQDGKGTGLKMEHALMGVFSKFDFRARPAKM